jgi:hypothetical protein
MSTKDATSRTAPQDNRPGTLEVTVRDPISGAGARDAQILLFEGPRDGCANFNAQQWRSGAHARIDARITDAAGHARFERLASGYYVVMMNHYGGGEPQCVDVRPGCVAQACIEIQIDHAITLLVHGDDCEPVACASPLVNQDMLVRLSHSVIAAGAGAAAPVKVSAGQGWELVSEPGEDPTFMKRWTSAGMHGISLTLGLHRLPVTAANAGIAAEPAGDEDALYAKLSLNRKIMVREPAPTVIAGKISTALSRTESESSPHTAFWSLIRKSTEALSFTSYSSFIDKLFCVTDRHWEGGGAEAFRHLRRRRALPFTDADSYRVLKVATEAFVMVHCGVLAGTLGDAVSEELAYRDRRDLAPPSGGDLQQELEQYLVPVEGGSAGALTLPYLAVIRRKLPDIPIALNGHDHQADLCFGIIQEKLTSPCLLELIWSYWHEEGMLVQTMNVITQRFQNLRASGPGRDPLANTEIDVLRPLNNLLWGYTQDEQHRLTVVRRNYEYDHHYGMRLEGRAVQSFRPADSRSKFLAAFHHLLRLCTVFFRQDDDTTVKADAFPVLNALKEVHLILSEGAHNQFGDLPSTARIEMLMQQWMLGRPEFREFLPTRLMVAYPEPWMDRVDAMKKLQGWTDTSVMHFRSLAIFGEQLLLSIRWGNWSDIYESSDAFNWARFWRPQIQGYIHAYRAATGVDLSADAGDPRVEGMLPSVLLRQQLARQRVL